MVKHNIGDTVLFMPPDSVILSNGVIEAVSGKSKRKYRIKESVTGKTYNGLEKRDIYELEKE